MKKQESNQDDRCCWMSDYYFNLKNNKNKQCPSKKKYGEYCELHAGLLGIREDIIARGK